MKTNFSGSENLANVYYFGYHFTVPIDTVSTFVLSGNIGRCYGLFVNDSDTAIYLTFGDTADINGVKLNPFGSAYEINANNMYLGPVSAIHFGTGTKDLRVLQGLINA